jgi:2-dehydropantoate 2-reductase
MKILMFGRGVIAVAYGWALERAGHEVEFYVRPGRAAEYGAAIDLELLDARRRWRGRRVTERWPVRYRESLEPDHDFDLIVVSVQHYGFAEAVSFLAPRVGKATVLVFNNLWVEPSAAVEALPAGQVAWVSPAPVEAWATTACYGPLCCPWSSSAPSAGRRPSGRKPCARRSARRGSKSGRTPTSGAGCRSTPRRHDDQATTVRRRGARVTGPRSCGSALRPR